MVIILSLYYYITIIIILSFGGFFGFEKIELREVIFKIRQLRKWRSSNLDLYDLTVEFIASL